MSDFSDLRDRLQAVLRRREPRYFDLLRHMVGINSFTGNPAGVEALGHLTAESFAHLGFESETVAAENPEFGPHLVMTRPARRKGPRLEAPAPKIGLVSHLDTVFTPEEEKSNDFAWREAGDRIYGPGTVDIKGGTVVIYMMMDALAAEAPEVFDAVRWVVLLNAAEERMALDFGGLARQRLADERTLACLVFEGGYLNDGEAPLVVSRKGMAVYRVDVEGRAAHAGSGHRHGANALVQMADVIRRVAAFTDYGQELTFNVGVVEGGTVVNRVPHRATAEVEMRCFDTDVYDEGLRKMLALREHVSVRSVDDGFPCSVRVEVTARNPPWSRNARSDRLLEVWQEAAQSLGMRVVPEERGGLSDGNQLWMDFPTLDGLGPSGGNAHCSEQTADGSKEQEYATRSSFVPKALLNVAAILRLLDTSKG